VKPGVRAARLILAPQAQCPVWNAPRVVRSLHRALSFGAAHRARVGDVVSFPGDGHASPRVQGVWRQSSTDREDRSRWAPVIRGSIFAL